MVLSNFIVIASQRARWRGNPFSFGSMWLILVCGGRRIATVAALPRNDRWETIPSRPNGVTNIDQPVHALSAATRRKC